VVVFDFIVISLDKTTSINKRISILLHVGWEMVFILILLFMLMVVIHVTNIWSFWLLPEVDKLMQYLISCGVDITNFFEDI
jgi:hypothetical protein